MEKYVVMYESRSLQQALLELRAFWLFLALSAWCLASMGKIIKGLELIEAADFDPEEKRFNFFFEIGRGG